MNLKEFKNSINEADEGLEYYTPCMPSGKHSYVCHAIDNCISSRANNRYEELFCPENTAWADPYFGKAFEENLNARKISLRLFEQHCIQHKLYLEF